MLRWPTLVQISWLKSSRILIDFGVKSGRSQTTESPMVIKTKYFYYFEGNAVRFLKLHVVFSSPAVHLVFTDPALKLCELARIHRIDVSVMGIKFRRLFPFWGPRLEPFTQ